jgi:hypothetical protein
MTSQQVAACVLVPLEFASFHLALDLTCILRARSMEAQRRKPESAALRCKARMPPAAGARAGGPRPIALSLASAALLYVCFNA